MGKEIDEGGTIVTNIETGDDYFIIGEVDFENDKFGSIMITQSSEMFINSDSYMHIKSGITMNIHSGSDMSIGSKSSLFLGNTDIDNIPIFSQSFEGNEYSLRGPEGDLIKYVTGDEFIEFFKRIKGIDAIQPDELTTKGQLDSKNYILSPDGQKWGISNTGETYKIT